MQSLERVIQENREKNITRVFVIHGISGVGKTQLALRYAKDHRTKYSNKCRWIEADSSGNLEHSFREFGLALGIYEQNKCLLIKAIYKKLERLSPTLIVFDNAENFSSLKAYLPPDDIICKSTFIFIVTSCNSSDNWRGQARIKLDPSDPNIKQSMINYISEKIFEGWQSKSIIKLAKTLGYLPLAVAQAVCYIKNQKIGINDYLKEYESHSQNRLNDKVPDAYERTVLSTFRMAFEKIQTQNKEAAELLSTCVYLHSSNIPRACVSQYFFRNPLASQMSIVVDLLRSYSIVDVYQEKSKPFLKIHCLVQKVIRLILEHQLAQNWWQGSLEKAACLINRLFRREDEPQGLSQAVDLTETNFKFQVSEIEEVKIMLPHVLTVLEHFERFVGQSQQNLSERLYQEVVLLHYNLGLYYQHYVYDTTLAGYHLDKVQRISEQNTNYITKSIHIKTFRQLYKVSLRKAAQKRGTQKIEELEQAESYLNAYIDLYIECCGSENYQVFCDRANLTIRKIEYFLNYPIEAYCDLEPEDQEAQEQQLTGQTESSVKLRDSQKTKESKKRAEKFLKQALEEIEKLEKKGVQKNQWAKEKGKVYHYYGSYHRIMFWWERGKNHLSSSIKNFTDALRCKVIKVLGDGAEEFISPEKIVKALVHGSKDDKFQISITLHQRGKIYKLSGQHNLDDLSHAQDDLKISLLGFLYFYDSLGHENVILNLVDLADIFERKHEFDKAIKCRLYARIALNTIQRSRKENIKKLLELYEKAGRFKEALDFYQALSMQEKADDLEKMIKPLQSKLDEKTRESIQIGRGSIQEVCKILDLSVVLYRSETTLQEGIQDNDDDMAIEGEEVLKGEGRASRLSDSTYCDNERKRSINPSQDSGASKRRRAAQPTISASNQAPFSSLSTCQNGVFYHQQIEIGKSVVQLTQLDQSRQRPRNGR